jgi:hypothetical protein
MADPSEGKESRGKVCMREQRKNVVIYGSDVREWKKCKAEFFLAFFRKKVVIYGSDVKESSWN